MFPFLVHGEEREGRERERERERKNVITWVHTALPSNTSIAAKQ